LAVTVTNASRNLVLIRTRSGPTIYLDSGEQTDELPEHEIIGNPDVEPLRERGLITVHTVDKSKPRAASVAGKASAKTEKPADTDGPTK
jgi:hypothetical protein